MMMVLVRLVLAMTASSSESVFGGKFESCSVYVKDLFGCDFVMKEWMCVMVCVVLNLVIKWFLL